MNPYHDLANAKDLLRQAKDYFETTRAVIEMGVMTLGKTVEDRKRELIVAVSQDVTYQQALGELRRAEYTVDTAQALIDQLEAERREREWAIRARLAEALGQHSLSSEDAVPDWLQDQRTARQAQATIDHLEHESAAIYALHDQAIADRDFAQSQMNDLYPTK